MASRVATSRWIPPAILVVVFLVATVALHGSVIGRDQYDDSYITYRYAANLATGKGPVFNSYERINSASSFLYTSVLAAAYSIGLHDLDHGHPLSDRPSQRHLRGGADIPAGGACRERGGGCGADRV